MKISRLSLLALIPALTLLVATPSQAQAPEGQLGIQAGTHGLGIQYALSPSLHIGGVLGLQAGDFAATVISIEPYVKFLLEGEVNPYFMVGLDLTSTSPDVGNSSTSTSLFAAFGLEYFATENVGLFGQASFFELGLDPSATFFGVLSGHAGVEYFFD